MAPLDPDKMLDARVDRFEDSVWEKLHDLSLGYDALREGQEELKASNREMKRELEMTRSIIQRATVALYSVAGSIVVMAFGVLMFGAPQ